VSPYRSAVEALTHSDADVVLVDPNGLHFGIDLVRNDPWLRQRPKIMDLALLSPDKLRRLCETKSVMLFDVKDGIALDMWRERMGPVPSQRRLLNSWGCARKHVVAD